MLNSNRLLKSKFGLSILLTAITFSLLIAGLAISGQPVTQASEITEKKNGVRPCKIDPKDMHESKPWRATTALLGKKGWRKL